MNPAELSYTTEHEWVRVSESIVRFGITDFAQDALDDIVYVNLPEVGADVSVGEACGEVESHKSVSDVFAPVGGRVSAINEAVVDDPALVNSDPYGAGWLVEIETSEELPEFLDAAAYEAHTNSL